MKNRNLKNAPGFDEIVFEIRNKEYGAYQLRKTYNRNVLTGMLIGSIIMVTAVVTPFLTTRAGDSKAEIIEQSTPVILADPNVLINKVTPPPAPPQNLPQKAIYVPPVVVDSVPENEAQFLAADIALQTVKNDSAAEVNLKYIIEIPDDKPKQEIFIHVDEMPMYPGGDAALIKYIADNVVYPEIALQNNIQGRVIVKFCVTASGSIDQVSILKGVDPGLDAEVIRVVKTVSSFRPGRQGGTPVPVWYTVPVNFQLK